MNPFLQIANSLGVSGTNSTKTCSQSSLYQLQKNIFNHYTHKHIVHTIPIKTQQFSTPSTLNAVLVPSKNSKSNTPIVLMHGFGAGAGVFAAMAETLSENNDVWAVDWLGCGLSGRVPIPQFHSNDSDSSSSTTRTTDGPTTSPQNSHQNLYYKTVLDYFIHPLKQLQDHLQLDKIHLAGHSLGGYLSTFYTHFYPEKVESLTNISPFGMLDAKQARQFPLLRDMTGAPRLELTFFDKLQILGILGIRKAGGIKVSPQSLIRNTGAYGKYLTERWFEFSFKIDDDNLREYIYGVSSHPQVQSHEEILPIFVENSLFPTYPLQQNVDLKVPFGFIYGQYDWMRCEYASAFSKNLNFQGIHVIPDVGHQLISQKPDSVSKAFLGLIKGDKVVDRLDLYPNSRGV